MAETNQRTIAVVTACRNKQGCPEFVLNHATVTPAEADNGIHYYLVEADLFLAGYEEPFLHFDEREAPPFLHPAVRQHLANSLPVLAEKHPCHA